MAFSTAYRILSVDAGEGYSARRWDLEKAAGACVPLPDSWRRSAEVTPDRRVNFSTRCSSMKRSGSGVYAFELVLEHMEDILNTDFGYAWCLHTGTHWPSRLCACYSGNVMFWGDLTKPIITNASVDYKINIAQCH